MFLFHLDGRKTVKKKQWTKEESAAVQRNMSFFLKKLKVPKKHECTACIDAEPEALKDRDWRAVKFFIKNQISTMRKKAFKL